VHSVRRDLDSQVPGTFAIPASGGFRFCHVGAYDAMSSKPHLHIYARDAMTGYGMQIPACLPAVAGNADVQGLLRAAASKSKITTSDTE
jgi:hypothetical protein